MRITGKQASLVRTAAGRSSLARGDKSRRQLRAGDLGRCSIALLLRPSESTYDTAAGLDRYVNYCLHSSCGDTRPSGLSASHFRHRVYYSAFGAGLTGRGPWPAIRGDKPHGRGAQSGLARPFGGVRKGTLSSLSPGSGAASKNTTKMSKISLCAAATGRYGSCHCRHQPSCKPNATIVHYAARMHILQR